MFLGNSEKKGINGFILGMDLDDLSDDDNF